MTRRLVSVVSNHDAIQPFYTVTETWSMTEADAGMHPLGPPPAVDVPWSPFPARWREVKITSYFEGQAAQEAYAEAAVKRMRAQPSP